MRGFLEELPFRQWIMRLTKARQEVLDRASLLSSARAGIAEGLTAGITTYGDTCESGVVHEALRHMGVRGVMYQEVFGPDPAQCEASMHGLREHVDELAAADTPLVRTGVSPHAPYSVSEALFAATATFARDRKFPMAVHAAESEAESQLVCAASGVFAEALTARGIAMAPRAPSTIALLERNDVLSARPLLIHCVQANSDDIAVMAKHRCSVAHCPASNAKLGHGVAPLSDFLDAGIAVGLGTDSVASNNRMDLLEEGRLALLMARGRHRSANIISPSRILELATLGAARALGLDNEVGSLAPGKAADLTVFALDEIRDVPSYDPASALVLAAGGRRARFVTVAGRVLVRDGQLIQDVTDDIHTIRRAAQALEQFARR